MKPIAIVYTSHTGHTAAYAKLLAQKTGLPTYTADAAREYIPKGEPIIYMGWLFAGFVKGYRKVAKRYKLCAVCGVGLSDTGSMDEQVRKNHKMLAAFPLFTLQGGMAHEKLKPSYKKGIDILTKMFARKQDRTPDEDRVLFLLQNGGDYVAEKHLESFLAWYETTYNTVTEVAAALIWDQDKFMICQRPAHKGNGLLWEFVGGKWEPGETGPQALARECREELGVEVEARDVFYEVVHQYPDILVHLTVYHAVITDGTPKLLEHNDLRWITPAEIPQYDFCPADTDILEKLMQEYG